MADDFDPDELNAAVPFRPVASRDPRRQAQGGAVAPIDTSDPRKPRRDGAVAPVAPAADPRMAPSVAGVMMPAQRSPLAQMPRPDQTRATQDRRNAEREARQNAAAAPVQQEAPRAGPTGAVDFNRYMATNQSAAKQAGQRAAATAQARGNAAREALDKVYRNWAASGAQGQFVAPQSVTDQYAAAQTAMADPLAGASWFDRALSNVAAAGDINTTRRAGARMAGDEQRAREEALAFQRRAAEQAAGERAAIEAEQAQRRQEWTEQEEYLSGAANRNAAESGDPDALDASNRTNNLSPEAYFAMFGEYPEGYEKGW
jgi:hypothetical protein